MTIHTVKVLAGFRFMLTNDDKWVEFCEALQDHVNGDGDDGSEHSDSESCSGSEHSGSEHGSDCEDEDEDECDECGDECGDAVDQVWDNMDKLMEELREKFPDVGYNTIKCFHNKEGMDRMIDIGYEFGDFSVCGDHEASHHDIDHAMNSMKNAKKVAFGNKLAELFLWKFCVTKKGPQMLGQTDDCMFCS